MIAFLCAGIVIGVVSAQYVPSVWFYSYGWLITGIALAVLGFWRARLYALIFIVAAGALIGLWRGSVSQQTLQPYHVLIGRTLTVSGVIDDDIEITKNNSAVVRLSSIYVEEHLLSGQLWISLSKDAPLKRGDKISVEGKLSDGFGSFAASMYRAKLISAERPIPGDIAGRLRDGFAENIRTVIQDPEASLGIGYIVGQRRTLPENLDSALRVSGLTHVVVASGYNLTILVRLARRLFVKVSKYLAAAASFIMIGGFIAVTGASPSMTRAGLVAGLSLLAWYYGRRFHPLVLLPFVAAITLLVNPSYGWSNLGWQLSFAAFAGVLIVAPLAQRYFFGEDKPSTIRQILGETLSAQLCTLPILIASFSLFSNVAVIANLLVLPLVPLAMLLTFSSGIVAIILPHQIASILAFPAQWLLQYMTGVAEYLASLSWAQTELEANWIFVAAFYGVIIAASLYMWRVTRYSLRNSNIVE